MCLSQEADWSSCRTTALRTETKTELLLLLQKASETYESCSKELSEHKELVEKCRSLQLKNQILVDKQLQAVQGVLDHLIHHGRQATTHTYENLR